MAKKILMNFDPEGQVTIEAKGYEGGNCLEATAPFEAMFGRVVKERVATGECAPDKDQGEYAT